jgi:hypothetical protein
MEPAWVFSRPGLEILMMLAFVHHLLDCGVNPRASHGVTRLAFMPMGNPTSSDAPSIQTAKKETFARLAKPISSWIALLALDVAPIRTIIKSQRLMLVRTRLRQSSRGKLAGIDH